MDKNPLFSLSITLLCLAVLLPDGTQQNRRIEEEKRDSLRPTEEKITYKKRVQPSLKEQVDNTFFQELLTRKTAYNKDACKVLVILLGAEEEYTDTETQVTFLERSDILPPDRNKFNPNRPLSKGTAAWMFYCALNIRGGLWLTLFGTTERYALRELIYEGIMSSGSVDELVSGKELILMLTKAAEYVAENISR